MVPVMQLLAIAGLIKSLVSTGSPLFKGSGYPNYEFYMQLVRGLVIIVVIYPLIAMMGISGAALGVIISIIGMVVVWYPLSQRITGLSGRQYLDTFWPPLLGSLLMAGSIYIIKLYWNPLGQSLITAISGFAIIVLMSILVYLGVLFILQKYYPPYDIFSEVKFFYKSLTGKKL